jgi:hypothetical protein
LETPWGPLGEPLEIVGNLPGISEKTSPDPQKPQDNLADFHFSGNLNPRKHPRNLRDCLGRDIEEPRTKPLGRFEGLP